MDVLLSIIVPAYNVEKYISKTLESFWCESILDFVEVIVVDDGSNDSTRKIVEDYVRKNSLFYKLISKNNGGHGSAINEGIENAKGLYLRVVDGDDWVNTDELKKYVQYLRKLNEVVDAIITPYNEVRVSDETTRRISFTGFDDYSIISFDDIIVQNNEYQYQMHSLTYRTEILKKMRKIDENCFYVDNEYLFYPIPFVERILILPFAIYQYRVGEASQSININNMIKNRDMHKRVIKSLIAYNKEIDMSEHKRELLKARIAGLCGIQFKVYSHMDYVYHKEIKEFIYFIKEQNSDIWKIIPGKRIVLIKILGMYYFWLLSFVNKHYLVSLHG